VNKEYARDIQIEFDQLAFSANEAGIGQEWLDRMAALATRVRESYEQEHTVLDDPVFFVLNQKTEVSPKRVIRANCTLSGELQLSAVEAAYSLSIEPTTPRTIRARTTP
jgi:hypothetical protein